MNREVMLGKVDVGELVQTGHAERPAMCDGRGWREMQLAHVGADEVLHSTNRPVLVNHTKSWQPVGYLDLGEPFRRTGRDQYADV